MGRKSQFEQNKAFLLFLKFCNSINASSKLGCMPLRILFEDASSFVKIGRKNLPMKVKPSKVVVLSKEENGGLKWLNKLPKGTQLD